MREIIFHTCAEVLINPTRWIETLSRHNYNYYYTACTTALPNSPAGRGLIPIAQITHPLYIPPPNIIMCVHFIMACSRWESFLFIAPLTLSRIACVINGWCELSQSLDAIFHCKISTFTQRSFFISGFFLSKIFEVKKKDISVITGSTIKWKTHTLALIQHKKSKNSLSFPLIEIQKL